MLPKAPINPEHYGKGFLPVPQVPPNPSIFYRALRVESKQKLFEELASFKPYEFRVSYQRMPSEKDNTIYIFYSTRNKKVTAQLAFALKDRKEKSLNIGREGDSALREQCSAARNVRKLLQEEEGFEENGIWVKNSSERNAKKRKSYGLTRALFKEINSQLGGSCRRRQEVWELLSHISVNPDNFSSYMSTELSKQPAPLPALEIIRAYALMNNIELSIWHAVPERKCIQRQRDKSLFLPNPVATIYLLDSGGLFPFKELTFNGFSAEELKSLDEIPEAIPHKVLPQQTTQPVKKKAAEERVEPPITTKASAFMPPIMEEDEDEDSVIADDLPQPTKQETHSNTRMPSFHLADSYSGLQSTMPTSIVDDEHNDSDEDDILEGEGEGEEEDPTSITAERRKAMEQDTRDAGVLLPLIRRQKYYELLGITKDATDSEIKKAYRKMAMKWHPDKNSSEHAEAVFKGIGEAYEILSDPEQRRAYDNGDSADDVSVASQQSAAHTAAFSRTRASFSRRASRSFADQTAEAHDLASRVVFIINKFGGNDVEFENFLAALIQLKLGAYKPVHLSHFRQVIIQYLVMSPHPNAATLLFEIMLAHQDQFNKEFARRVADLVEAKFPNEVAQRYASAVHAQSNSSPPRQFRQNFPGRKAGAAPAPDAGEDRSELSNSRVAQMFELRNKQVTAEDIPDLAQRVIDVIDKSNNFFPNFLKYLVRFDSIDQKDEKYGKRYFFFGIQNYLEQTRHHVLHRETKKIEDRSDSTQKELRKDFVVRVWNLALQKFDEEIRKAKAQDAEIAKRISQEDSRTRASLLSGNTSRSRVAKKGDDDTDSVVSDITMDSSWSRDTRKPPLNTGAFKKKKGDGVSSMASTTSGKSKLKPPLDTGVKRKTNKKATEPVLASADPLIVPITKMEEREEEQSVTSAASILQPTKGFYAERRELSRLLQELSEPLWQIQSALTNYNIDVITAYGGVAHLKKTDLWNVERDRFVIFVEFVKSEKAQLHQSFIDMAKEIQAIERNFSESDHLNERNYLLYRQQIAHLGVRFSQEKQRYEQFEEKNKILPLIYDWLMFLGSGFDRLKTIATGRDSIESRLLELMAIAERAKLQEQTELFSQTQQTLRAFSEKTTRVWQQLEAFLVALPKIRPDTFTEKTQQTLENNIIKREGGLISVKQSLSLFEESIRQELKRIEEENMRNASLPASILPAAILSPVVSRVSSPTWEAEKEVREEDESVSMSGMPNVSAQSNVNANGSSASVSLASETTIEQHTLLSKVLFELQTQHGNKQEKLQTDEDDADASSAELPIVISMSDSLEPSEVIAASTLLPAIENENESVSDDEEDEEQQDDEEEEALSAAVAPSLVPTQKAATFAESDDVVEDPEENESETESVAEEQGNFYLALLEHIATIDRHYDPSSISQTTERSVINSQDWASSLDDSTYKISEAEKTAFRELLAKLRIIDAEICEGESFVSKQEEIILVLADFLHGSDAVMDKHDCINRIRSLSGEEFNEILSTIDRTNSSINFAFFGLRETFSDALIRSDSCENFFKLRTDLDSYQMNDSMITEVTSATLQFAESCLFYSDPDKFTKIQEEIKACATAAQQSYSTSGRPPVFYKKIAQNEVNIACEDFIRKYLSPNASADMSDVFAVRDHVILRVITNKIEKGADADKLFAIITSYLSRQHIDEDIKKQLLSYVGFQEHEINAIDLTLFEDDPLVELMHLAITKNSGEPLKERIIESLQDIQFTAEDISLIQKANVKALTSSEGFEKLSQGKTHEALNDSNREIIELYLEIYQREKGKKLLSEDEKQYFFLAPAHVEDAAYQNLDETAQAIYQRVRECSEQMRKAFAQQHKDAMKFMESFRVLQAAWLREEDDIHLVKDELAESKGLISAKLLEVNEKLATLKPSPEYNALLQSQESLKRQLATLNGHEALFSHRAVMQDRQLFLNTLALPESEQQKNRDTLLGVLNETIAQWIEKKQQLRLVLRNTGEMLDRAQVGLVQSEAAPRKQEQTEALSIALEQERQAAASLQWQNRILSQQVTMLVRTNNELQNRTQNISAELLPGARGVSFDEAMERENFLSNRHTFSFDNGRYSSFDMVLADPHTDPMQCLRNLENLKISGKGLDGIFLNNLQKHIWNLMKSDDSAASRFLRENLEFMKHFGYRGKNKGNEEKIIEMVQGLSRLLNTSCTPSVVDLARSLEKEISLILGYLHYKEKVFASVEKVFEHATEVLSDEYHLVLDPSMRGDISYYRKMLEKKESLYEDVRDIWANKYGFLLKNIAGKDDDDEILRSHYQKITRANELSDKPNKAAHLVQKLMLQIQLAVYHGQTIESSKEITSMRAKTFSTTQWEEKAKTWSSEQWAKLGSHWYIQEGKDSLVHVSTLPKANEVEVKVRYAEQDNEVVLASAYTEREEGVCLEGVLAGDSSSDNIRKIHAETILDATKQGIEKFISYYGHWPSEKNKIEIIPTDDKCLVYMMGALLSLGVDYNAIHVDIDPTKIYRCSVPRPEYFPEKIYSKITKGLGASDDLYSVRKVDLKSSGSVMVREFLGDLLQISSDDVARTYKSPQKISKIKDIIAIIHDKEIAEKDSITVRKQNRTNYWSEEIERSESAIRISVASQ